jgi:large subunit ribosomal protein L28
MPNECYVCAKKTVAGNTVSHSNIHTKRVFKPNLRRVKISEQGTVKTVKVCTRCLRSGKVVRA